MRNDKKYLLGKLFKTDWKGEFVEKNIYDYFDDKGYSTKLTYTGNGQRMMENNEIIVPDLLIENRYDEIFFIESKSSWEYYYNTNPKPFFEIEKYKMNAYLKFYNTVFPRKSLEGFSSVYIAFVDCIYNDDWDGTLYVNMQRFENLVNLYWEQSKTHVYWCKKEIKDTASRKFKIDFKHDKDYVFKTKFANDVMCKSRDTIKITKKWIDEQIEYWEKVCW